MAEMTPEELVASFPEALEDLSSGMNREPRCVTAQAKVLGHIHLENGDYAEVQLTLERDEREWLDLEFTEEVQA
jgi:hypothetical protein